jgi:hypothetical protein
VVVGATVVGVAPSPPVVPPRPPLCASACCRSSAMRLTRRW